MSQTLQYWLGDTEIRREMPDPDMEVVPGVCWGEPWILCTPAYWLSQLWMKGLNQAARSPHQARGSLADELVFCMLGGYGIKAELAMAAFETCRKAKLISRLEPTAEAWADQLRQPLMLNGRPQKYRYPNQKARFIAGAMVHLHEHTMEGYGGRELRNALLKINGVGAKTAGWVARNYLDTDEVAILDIHLIRAGLLCDLFKPDDRVERDYLTMEARFIDFCRALDARPALLDCLIWDQMRAYGKIPLDALRYKRATSRTPTCLVSRRCSSEVT